MLEIILGSIIVPAGALLTLSRVFSWSKIVKHSVIVDVVLTLIFILSFSGTYTGMMIAMLAGFNVACFFTIYKKIKKTKKV